MRTIDKEELKEILRKHGEWLIDPNKGERANLSYANLRYADLRCANLRYADLSYADLRCANLRYADLSYADLSYANLSYANLRYADLSCANLRYADLSYADLRYADLSYADLSYADLSYANLRCANLSYAVGNSNQIKTLQTETYVVTYTNTVMAIGCKQYSIKEWKNFKDREIEKMDSKALEFWKKWKPILKKIGVFDND
jgi:uncharacterized protein YjbI with pentapeptide repeats